MKIENKRMGCSGEKDVCKCVSRLSITWSNKNETEEINDGQNIPRHRGEKIIKQYNDR
jgi:hypothetical protein